MQLSGHRSRVESCATWEAGGSGSIRQWVKQALPPCGLGVVSWPVESG